MTDLLLRSRYRLVLLFVVLFLGISLATRLILVTAHHALTEPWMAAALAVGEVYDLLAGLWLAVPLFLFLTFLPERWFRSRIQSALLRLWAFVAIFALLFVAVVEGFFFAEFDGRFNFVAVDYLMYPTEVVTNIWESYPTGQILAVIAVFSAGLVLLFDRQLRRAREKPATPGRRAGFAAVYACLLAALTVAVSPSLAQVSRDRALNEIASNGYYCFWMALLGSDAPYEGLYATRPAAAIRARLPRLLAEPAAVPASFVSGSTRRHVRALGPERKMNVVVVLEESLGSELVGALHPRPESLTPNYDALTREGTLFTHAYSTGNRTIRAIEATTSSLPPLPGISIVRRSQSEDLFTLPALLRSRGYQTLWVYGGRALFDGMGHYLRHNGVDRIVEQKDYPAGTFKTAWGVADEAIFDRALAEMDRMQAAGRPFYTLILSVSNHRPFRFPEGAVRPDPKLHGRENAVRYADYAVGRFLRQARGHSFFQNTLFVVMGDHGARVYGAAEIPLPSYEVPILFYAPGVIPAGQRIDTLASAMDIPPTILGVLGVEYDSKFFGHDLFRIDPSAGRALMTHNNEIALLRGARMAVLGLHASTALYDVTPDGALNPVPAPDAGGRELIEDAIAYYNGADREYRAGGYTFAGSRRGEQLARASPLGAR
ncbi:MAG TPA: LTA synthase family protein [Thermoanaerobaculia bacterium]|nr:LTA synthase family protein [Thermoanaerobaculia bacterium]